MDMHTYLLIFVYKGLAEHAHMVHDHQAVAEEGFIPLDEEVRAYTNAHTAPEVAETVTYCGLLCGRDPLVRDAAGRLGFRDAAFRDKYLARQRGGGVEAGALIIERPFASNSSSGSGGGSGSGSGGVGGGGRVDAIPIPLPIAKSSDGGGVGSVGSVGQAFSSESSGSGLAVEELLFPSKRR